MQTHECRYAEVIIKPPANLGHPPGKNPHDQGHQGGDPGDADADIEVGLEPSHGRDMKLAAVGLRLAVIMG